MPDYERLFRPYPGWNVPFKPGDTFICEPDTDSMCYDSCKSLGKCEQCSWTTCYNDLLFMRKLVEHIKENLCIDDDLIFLAGCSNGGIFTYYLS